MPMNPIETREAVRRDYIDYLSSILTVRSEEITEKARRAVAAAGFTKGPFLESTQPFRAGASLEVLAREGVISAEFAAIAEDIHYTRSLYLHQEKAIRKIVSEERNIIVATGTGSGKTECYLYPIFNALMREKEQGTLDKPGVRAILLFPMNALANDQLKKLRIMLKDYPDIQFGRYTGETSRKESEEDARLDYIAKNPGSRIPQNELFTRKRMQESPPHILLTNYAMLEYLLLRPDDAPFFDRHSLAKFWKLIVLDEAHTYRGAAGTEIAFLLRRLKQRIYLHTEAPLRCIATSATLGNDLSKKELAEFATNIFGEPFFEDSIISATRIKREKTDAMRRFTPADYLRIKAEVAAINDEEQRGNTVYMAMRDDTRVIELQELLANDPKDFNVIADDLFQDAPTHEARRQALADLVELSAMARPDANTAALLPARYHLFARSLEGMFASFYPETRVYLERREIEPTADGAVCVFELANCKRCSQEYIRGVTKEGKLHQTTKENERAEFYLISRPDEERIQLDEDDFAAVDTAELELYTLCTHCGSIVEGPSVDGSCCSCKDMRKLLPVYRLSIKGVRGSTSVCAACGARAENVIAQFTTANQAATYTLTDSLYRMIPPRGIGKSAPVVSQAQEDDFFEAAPATIPYSPDILEESGRKLLVFSDNRQEAAFFAGYAHNSHNRTMWQLLILRTLKEREALGKETSVCDLISLLRYEAEKYDLYAGIADSELKKEQLASWYVMREFLGIDAATGLEGRGYISFTPKQPDVNGGRWGFSKEETSLLFRAMLDTLRKQGASNYPEYVKATDEFFAPRNHAVYFAQSKATEEGIVSFIPSQGRENKRSIYLKRLLKRDPANASQAEFAILETICSKALFSSAFLNSGYIVSENRRDVGMCYTLNHAAWNVAYIGENDTLYRCSRCGKLFSYSIRAVCPEFRCSGTLMPVTAREARNDPYYTRLYGANKVLPMVAKEHTAQLTKDAASDYQRGFEEGHINLLSCSTTFEMGVDVGELEAILLRNVPPETANYIQRAGRAGRRTSSAAFSLTFARRNSHDLNYYRHPEAIINGRIHPPYVEINNEKLAKRHIHAVILSWLFKKHPELFKNVNAFIGRDGNPDSINRLIEEVSGRPGDLLEAVRAVLSPELFSAMRIEDWHFTDELVAEVGTLRQAVDHRIDVLDQLSQRREELFAAAHKHDMVDRLMRTYAEEGVIPFLSSNGILPKHGFPIDIVSLDVLNNTEVAKKIDLSRDLKLAIGEYAPPSQIVANGKIWTSSHVNIMPNKGWPAFRYYECTSCGYISSPKGEVVFGENDPENEAGLEPCPMCTMQMHPKTFIIPQFGFSTSFQEAPKLVGDTRPVHGYTNRVQFCGIEGDALADQETKEQLIHGRLLATTYAAKGKLMVVNNGNGHGLWVCDRCGHMLQFPPKGKDAKHDDKYGRPCTNRYYLPVSLGHTYLTDILRVVLPKHFGKFDGDPAKDVTLSTLYAVLDGAADALGIARSDIDGCIDHENSGALLLFDTAAGGAGHVKKISDNLSLIFQAAQKRVDGSCGCSEETSCYGCLRNYENQYFHDKLTRGGALEYLSWLLSGKAAAESLTKPAPEQPEEETQPTLSEAWRKCIASLVDDTAIRSCAHYLAENGAALPADIGLDLTSPHTGEVICEAEMVWRLPDRLIAVLTPGNAEHMSACEAADILAFSSDQEEELDTLLQILLQGGMPA